MPLGSPSPGDQQSKACQEDEVPVGLCSCLCLPPPPAMFVCHLSSWSSSLVLSLSLPVSVQSSEAWPNTSLHGRLMVGTPDPWQGDLRALGAGTSRWPPAPASSVPPHLCPPGQLGTWVSQRGPSLPAAQPPGTTLGISSLLCQEPSGRWAGWGRTLLPRRGHEAGGPRGERRERR